MRFLIGIDDTDNLTSGGTGNLCRQLGAKLAELNLAQPIGITRHQLFLSPEIPFTSHNSSACIMVEIDTKKVDILADYCQEFLLNKSEPGSDVGLCFAQWDQVTQAVQTFGKQAKEKVLTQEEALSVAHQAGLHLEGLTGTKDGIIGALASVGLRKTENDGRFLWLPGLRDLEGVFTAQKLYQTATIDRIQDLEGRLVAENTKIQTSPWPRPVLLNGQAILLVEKTTNSTQEIGEKEYEYQIAPKSIIRQY
ncbi:hypothetical protein SD80_032965 [Scytonema tolypothrichoides VB-61278]|nr:hypothetical protein SD80_032965 [Scytonema tolypothrichoides VB-61278]